MDDDVKNFLNASTSAAISRETTFYYILITHMADFYYLTETEKVQHKRKGVAMLQIDVS